jgi:hypothetical protein
MAVFFDNRTVGQGGSMRQNGPIGCPLCSYIDRAVWLGGRISSWFSSYGEGCKLRVGTP